MQAEVLVGIGANLPRPGAHSPLAGCWWALNQLSLSRQLRFRSLSHWYRSAPVPVSDQPDFVNAVVLFSAASAPELILDQLHEVENRAGRVRTFVNAARVIDLDLLAVGQSCRDGPGLVLPHPRLHERAFVLHPLCDVAPGWRHPRLGSTASALRDRVAGQRIDRLPDRTERVAETASRH